MMHVPVAVITERLRAQSLDDDQLKAHKEGALQIEGKNVWAACDGDPSRDPEGFTTTSVLPATTTPAVPSSASLRERGMSSSTSLPFLPPLHDNDRMMVASGTLHRTSPTTGVFPATPRGFPPTKTAAVRVRSGGGGLEFGPRCGGGGGGGGGEHTPKAFETPPKKKQCRSLSVPVDSPPHGPGLLTSSAFVEGAKVWRPIPITALTSTSSNVCSSGSSPVQPDPRSPVTPFVASSDSRTFSSFTAVGGSTAARFYRDFKVVGSGGGVGGGGGGGGSGGTSSTFPLAPSPLSVDSGRDTTSEPHTPSQSPVPRPASASSLRSCHPFSSSSSASWWSAYSPGRIRGGGEVFFPASRSVSYEEQISMGILQASAIGAAGTSSGSSPCMGGGV